MKKSDLLSHMLMDGFQEEDSNPIDIKFIIHQYLKYWWLFAIGLIVSLSLAMVYIFYSIPQYDVSASLLIKVDQGIGFTKNAVFSDLEAYESSSKVENELEVLGSYSLMRDAIEDLPLQASFFVEDKYGRIKEIYGAQVPVEVEVYERSAGGQVPEDQDLRIHLTDTNFSLVLSEDQRQTFEYGERIENWYGVFSIEKSGQLNETTPKDLIVRFNNKDQLAGRY